MKMQGKSEIQSDYYTFLLKNRIPLERRKLELLQCHDVLVPLFSNIGWLPNNWVCLSN